MRARRFARLAAFALMAAAVCARAADYDNLMKGYRTWLGDLPPETARRIAWDNGARLFGVSDK